MLGTKYNEIARDDTHVYKVTHAFYVFPFSLLQTLFTKKGPKLSMPAI